MKDTYNGLTNNFIEELEEFLNEKFDGEWEMNFQVDGRAIDIRLLMSPEERVVVKKGNVILVKEVASSIFFVSSINPGAINPTKIGIKTSITKTRIKRPKNNKLKI